MQSPASLLRTIDFSHLNATANRALVSAYKLAGFFILSAILLGITSFVGVHTFYLIHRAWVVPRIISPTDPDVVALRGRIAEETWKRESIESERRAATAKLERLRLIAQAEQSFRNGLPNAMANGAEQGRQSLAALEAAREEQRRVSAELSRIGQSLQESTREQLERDFQAGLISEQERLASSYQLLQLAQARSSLVEREAELNERIRRLSREVGALEIAGATADDAGQVVSPSYEGLLLRREHARSRAEGVGAASEIAALELSLAEFDRALASYDILLAELQADALFGAREQPLHVAFIAYQGESSVGEGAPLYGCHLALAFCERAGRVKRYLPGEHAQEHPVYGKELRGQWVEIELDDRGWAKAQILHANRPPLLF